MVTETLPLVTSTVREDTLIESTTGAISSTAAANAALGKPADMTMSADIAALAKMAFTVPPTNKCRTCLPAIEIRVKTHSASR
ncbi:hypothetical protein NOK12_00270 [Nocardioides sp. OK12]|nr:hypothetical protein NOK12_00270 [Nocardioides sp. OK12]